MAQICVTIARRRHKMLLEDMDAAVRDGAKLLEIRLDYLNRDPRISEILANRKCPLIATVRRKEDGGQWRATEAQRLRVVRAAIAAGFDYVDLEIDVAKEVNRFSGGKTKRIISYHNMQEMPENVVDLHAQMKQLDADIVKIAAKANHPADIFTMFELLKKVNCPTVAFCMGDMGVASRVLSAKFGSPFTYSAFSPLRVIAPGMLTFEELRERFHYELINAETEVYGVIGNPIGHSLSPLIHNAGFAELGLNKVYLPFRVPEECLDGFINEAMDLPIAGLSVTIPHKVAIRRYGADADAMSARCRASNTLVRKEGRYFLYNTDGPAAVSSLENAIRVHPETGLKSVEGRTVLILGAGGVSRIIAHSLVTRGAIVVITARNGEKAHALASEVGCSVMEWSQRHTRRFDVIVNGTPVGMYPDVDESPFHPSALQEGTVAFDTIYNPEITMFLRNAAERDCIVVSGVEMFVRQAEAQFRLFTEHDPPPGLMARLVREELSPARNMIRAARLGGAATK